MRVTAIKTRKMMPPKDDLFELIDEAVKQMNNEEVLVVTSKIVAIGEGRCVTGGEIEKDELIKKEAELYVDRDMVPGEFILLTIKNGLMIASAGIDASNANGYLVMWPEDSYASAKRIYYHLKERFGLKRFGVVVTDSHTTPMRRGVLGVSLGHFGFCPIESHVGSRDIFGRELKVSVSDVADAIAVAAVMEMGEAGEQKPLAVCSEIERPIRWSEDEQINRGGEMAFEIPMEEDLYYPLLSKIEWKKGGGGK